MTNMHPLAHHAVRAANNVKNWGPYAARQYAKKRGVPNKLFELAQQLRARQYLNQAS